VTTQSVGIQTVCDAPEWWYFMRRFILPEYNYIALGPDRNEQSPFMAKAILAAMNVDIAPITEGKDSSEAWRAVARLTNKTIHLMAGPDEYNSQEVATYYPDGRVELKR